MRTASLMLVLAAAKAAALAGHNIPASLWSPFAYFWHDAAVVLIFAAAEFLLARRQRIVWMLYGALALYAAINIPVVRAVSTPLTWSMLRAARGALSDSIWHYATWLNAVLFLSVIGLAVLSPLLLRNVSHKMVLTLLTVCVAAGPSAAARVDTLGLERNAWTALIPRISRQPALPAEWKAAGFDRTRHEGLAQFHGAGAGRNIVLVSLESTAAQYLGVYGAQPDPMPNLSRLAREAIVFENAYAVYPESIKGLFSILCSAYPAFGSAAESYAKYPCQSLAAVLEGADYRTAMFHSGRFMYLGMEAVIRGRGFHILEDAGHIGGNHESSFGIDEPATVARILRWIDTLPRGQRFFVTYLPIAGHHPYETSERGPFPDIDEWNRYRNALHSGDAALGALIEGLRSRGLDRDTLWIILGDHGEAFGQHEGNYGHTFHLYEENVRVPFLIAAPGLLSRQIRSRQVVSLIDTAPTALALAGLPSPANYQGRSALDPSPRMALFFADYSLGMLGLRDGPYKYIYEADSGRSRLFNLETDREEKVNLAARYSGRVRWYQQDLRNWSVAQKHLVAAK